MHIMSLDDIALPMSFVKDAWPSCGLRKACAAINLIAAWGLKYRAYVMVWHIEWRTAVFQVADATLNLCRWRKNPRLIGQKGFMTCFNAARRGHCVKPADYNTLEE